MTDELWADYCEAATSMSSDNGTDLYDIEGMDSAAHDIYLALVTACAERDALAAALIASRKPRPRQEP